LGGESEKGGRGEDEEIFRDAFTSPMETLGGKGENLYGVLWELIGQTEEKGIIRMRENQFFMATGKIREAWGGSAWARETNGDSAKTRVMARSSIERSRCRRDTRSAMDT